MKYQDEYRDPAAAQKLLAAIRRIVSRPWAIMEVCGGQTHSIVKYGIDELLPPEVELIHGPGCPVCVTPLELIDQAIELAARPEVIFCSFGDMLRVPGSGGDLLSVKADGGDVRIVYSPLDCLRIAEQNPNRMVVFFAVGFETTAPANAMAIQQAKRRNLKNFAALVSHVLVPPAMTAILSSPANRVQGFLGAGHVCTIMGCDEYAPLTERFRVPVVVTGFEPVDLLDGIYRCVRMLERGEVGVQNQYARAVRNDGNPLARRLLDEVFEVTDRKWRGIGMIPLSGYRLSPAYADFDAQQRLAVSTRAAAVGQKRGLTLSGHAASMEISACPPKDQTPFLPADACISGLILQGLKKPHQCPAFGTTCVPEHPLGATMVSSEGACAAYYHYGRYRDRSPAPCRSETADYA